jgi:broad specificity phosphatase PhoE
MEIWLVRHGETFGNQKSLIQGHSGGKLTKLGEQQALLNQKKLKNIYFDDVYVSDSFRARQTAGIILGNSAHSKVHLSPLLREKGGGVLEGMPLSAFRNMAK